MSDGPGPLWTCLALVTAAATAGAAALVLQTIATPVDFQARRSALESQTRRIEALSRQVGDEAAFPKGAVCETPDGVSIQLREALDRVTVAQQVHNLQITVQPPVAVGGELAPLPLRLQIEGGYPSLLRWLDEARRLTPTIFVDTADLASVGSQARLTMTGRVFCWTRG